MEKIWYDAISGDWQIDKPRNVEKSKRYFYIEDTVAERDNAIKTFIYNSINDMIKNSVESIVRFKLEESMYTSNTYLKMYFGYFDTCSNIYPEKTKKISTLGIAKIKKFFSEAIREIFEKDNYIIDFGYSYSVTYDIIFLDKVIKSEYDLTNETLLISTTNRNSPYRLSIERKKFIKSGKDLWIPLKVDISNYVSCIKKNINRAKSALLRTEKTVETLKKKLLQAQQEYDELEDYEKIIGEIGYE